MQCTQAPAPACSDHMHFPAPCALCSGPATSAWDPCAGQSAPVATLTAARTAPARAAPAAALSLAPPCPETSGVLAARKTRLGALKCLAAHELCGCKPPLFTPTSAPQLSVCLLALRAYGTDPLVVPEPFCMTGTYRLAFYSASGYFGAGLTLLATSFMHPMFSYHYR